MIDFLYLNGWGPFIVTLFFTIPFMVVFVYVIVHKSNTSPNKDYANSIRTTLSGVEKIWIGVVGVLFVGFNLMSIGYMPTTQTAEAAINEKNVQQVDVTAVSWSYDISNRTVEAGRPVRFSGTSTDTMHGFAIYHPDGDVLFTMMLMPGLKNPTSIVHTFDEPGIYIVRCLEYCGIAHHVMQDRITVVQNTK